MPETQEKTGLFVEPSEAFVDLLKIPDKPTRLQRLGGSPSRWVGLILLALIWVPSIVHYKNAWGKSWGNIDWSPKTTVQQSTYYITITKGAWSRKIDTTGRRFRVVSVTPPARRMTMVNGNPDRIHHLPAGPASNINVGTDVRSHEFMIEPDETVSSSVVGYEFY